MKVDPLKIVITAVATLYFLWCAYNPAEWRFIDGVNMLCHEGGHLIFIFFGDFIRIAGGTLAQLLVPIALIGYFSYYGRLYSAAIVGMWLGQNLLNVSVYAGDANAMQLPLTAGLTGAEKEFHDWNYMLTELGSLKSADSIAMALRGAGTIIILVSAYLSFKFAVKDMRI
jgi:hypothetical protein